MSRVLFYCIFCFFMLATMFCNGNRGLDERFVDLTPSFASIGDIPLPAGYTRITEEKNSFAATLRDLKLKKDNRVHLYDGSLKPDQSAQFAVLDIPIGNKNLLQCADAAIKLRADFFFNKGQTDRLVFKGTDGTALSFGEWLKGVRYKVSGNHLVSYRSGISEENRATDYLDWLDFVFTYCGTISLEAETGKVKNFGDIQPGNILVKAGSPGHAMTVVDMATNAEGKKIFLLSQGYMPAQEIHIVKNPMDKNLSPWYEVNGAVEIVTPGWVFHKDDLHNWK